MKVYTLLPFASVETKEVSTSEPPSVHFTNSYPSAALAVNVAVEPCVYFLFPSIVPATVESAVSAVAVTSYSLIAKHATTL